MDCDNFKQSQFSADYSPTSPTGAEYVQMNCSNVVDNITESDYYGGFDAELYREMFRQALYTHKSPSTIVLIVLYSLSFVVGVVGNVLVMVVWFKNKHIQTVINFFLVNLAVCDLMVILFCMPITIGNVIYNEWIYGEVMCKLTPCIQGMSVSASVFILTAISLNRFYAIHNPLKARVLYTRQRVRNAIIVIWVISLLLMIPILVVNRLETVESKIPELTISITATTCTEVWSDISLKHAYNIFLFLIQFAIPMTFMFFAYAMIVKALVTNDVELGKERNPDKQVAQQNKNRSKVIRLLMVVVSLFAVSWFPFHVATIWFDFNTTKAGGYFSVEILPFLQWLGLCNSSLNPVCYCFLSKTYRRIFKATIQCRWDRMESMKNGMDGHFAHSIGVDSSRKRNMRKRSRRTGCIQVNYRGVKQSRIRKVKNGHLCRNSELLQSRNEETVLETVV
ncbi:QRFP-like peptide receptor [Glandiceps talaboti]